MSAARTSRALVLAGWFLLCVALERALAVFLPTTWECDALTRAQMAFDIARDGVSHYFLVCRETTWLPGYMLFHSVVLWLFGGNPVELAEYTSAVSAGLLAGYTYLLGGLAGLDERNARRTPALFVVSGYALAYF